MNKKIDTNVNQPIRYIDAHGHIGFEQYDNDRSETIERAEKLGVAMVAVGTNAQTSAMAVETATKYQNVFATVGIHPTDSAEFADENIMRSISALAKRDETVAIGEVGLDYFRADEGTISSQRSLFESMINLSQSVSKPLMLHLRSGSSRSAYKDGYDMIAPYAKSSPDKIAGDLHFFAGSIEEAKPFLDLGFYFSFTGVITFARSYDEVIKYIPLDRIMSETDCPYVAPVPYRGKRNEPAFVIEVAKMIAKIKNQDEAAVEEQLLNNAKKFFGI